MFTNDASSSAAIHRFATGTQVLALPLIQNGHVNGVLAIVADPNQSIDLPNELGHCQRILEVATAASENLTLLASTQTALQHMQTVTGISRELNDVSCVRDAYSRVCEQLIGGLDVCQAGVVIFDVDGSVIDKTLYRSPERSLAYEFQIDEANLEAVCLQCLEKPDVVVHSPEATHSSHFAFAVPLKKDDKLTGAVCVLRSADKFPLDTAILDTLRTVTLQLNSTIERINLTKALKHQAFHDQLTCLPNRTIFEIELQQLLDAKVPGVLLFIDLDGFKDVNDTLGHAVGDELLRLVAKRLNNTLKQGDTLARMGGDEFAVICRELNEKGLPQTCADRMLKTLSRTFDIDDAKIKISASIGISRLQQDGDTINKLLRNADAAMYEAKNRGKGCVVQFSDVVADPNREVVLRIKNDIQTALQENHFELHYQPQLSCSCNQVIGAEALLRWNHPTQGVIPPSEFIPLAEQSGLILDIGNWVIDRAIGQLAEWQIYPEFENIRIGINVAPCQLQQDEFVDYVIERINYYSVPAQMIELELTENYVMQDVKKVAKHLKALQDIGVRIAIDDFGTGYSSLSYLQDLPLNVLKIDKAFVSRLEYEDPVQSLANTITLLAVGLGLETIAEGVETLKQRDAITEMGCDLIQGHYYSEALAPKKMLEYVTTISSSGSSS